MGDRPRDMPVVDVVRMQQAACARAGSQVYEQVLEAIADDVAAGGSCAALMDPWAENALADAVPLRLLAAVHRLVLEGRAPRLGAHYPSVGGTDAGDPGPAFLAVVAAHRDELAEQMHRGVQTNEAGRACALFGGFHRVARAGLPLRILEVGSSAGLLLRWDRYGYRSRASGFDWGPHDGLVFDDPWTTRPPDVAPDLMVAERSGCDIEPIDPTTRDGVVLLQGFLWPDQRERRARLDAAIEVARRFPATVERADAAAWLERQLAVTTPGMATVVFHSIVLQYLPRSSFEGMREVLAAAGERAGAEAPLHWLRMEPAGVVADVRMRSWPGDEEVELASTGYHGPPVDWLS